MKRNLLAIAIPALLIAGTANASIEVWNKDGNKVDFYGRVYALNYITDRNNQTGEGDKTTARLGMSGQTQITDSLTGYGRWEYEAKTGKDADNETRYAFAGLNFGDFGSFDYGRNDGVLKTLTSYTDVLPEFGGDASNNDFYALTARTKAVATYRNSDFFGLVDGLRFAVQYADNGDNSSTDHFNRQTQNGHNSAEAWGSVVDWDVLDTGLTVGAGYAQTGGHKDAKSWSAGVKYDNNNIYLAALYIEGKQKYGWNNASTNRRADDLKTKGFEIVAQYGIDFDIGRLTPSVAYIQHKVKDASSLTSDAGLKGNDLAKYVDVGLTYDFNKNLSAIVDYKINLLDKDDIGARRALYEDGTFTKSQIKATAKDTVALGLIYQF
ncbi:porin [Gilliamella sp. B2776]|uniref:porin n=1 Tax=unclassified Gilliamella TaxID=2685620 RepID=UPI00226A59A5|nr:MULTISPECIES: porin [unclassified Gilliamella]MCX8649274.1 porin [Gilliamella sp. B2779]MCX8655112.1 porin [Gilliamella sp. B2737]MCX8655884.1 porin [Gilliamella sp. B2894]MCX8663988.1 porin [Gilliamella sp. B2887]MCX8691231.1 porin [Gilliamella sp. B2776]